MELARFPSRGGFSLRSIFTFALAVLLTVLIGVLFLSPSVHAADATWDGASLRYDGNQYISMGNAPAGNSMGIPDASPYYAYIESPTQSSSGAAPTTQKAYVIYFAAGTSPPSETSASYAEYDYTANSKTFTNATNQQSVTIAASTTNTGTSCAIEGIGWLACPAMTWLADGMDNIFTLIAGFMEVQPLQTNNTDGTLYTAWNTMRGIANIAFIIVFLIIIYAQLTNVQLSKYGLKKLLPRLIIAAIAINVSYIAAAVAVDVSNILGYSIQDLFMAMQRAIVDSGTVDPAAQASLNSIQSWGGFTAFAISGGAAAVVGVSTAMAATGGTIAAAAYLLLPILLGLLLALILVLLILAARQAIIIILVIIAPLAIVAYLLPNTEKWFEKWRGLFMTMLIFFPAFAVVFGGAQLAGAIIIKNANSVTMQLLGMVVQVAPLVITPLLLKLGGGVLGNIARIVNDPKKGLIDRTRNWSQGHADWHRQRGIGGLDRHGNPMNLTRRNFLRNSARHMDQRKKRLADRTANAATATQTAYENSHLYTARPNRRGAVRYDMAQQKARFEDEKAATHSLHEAHVNDARRVQGSLVYQSGINAQTAKDHATTSQNYTDSFYNNARRDQRIAAGALHASGYRVEMSKDRLATTENLKTAYYNDQRAQAGTDLNALARPLETSKLRVEIAQNTYSAAVEEWKAMPGTGINLAAQRAQSSKDHLEGAQAQLQAFFDAQRATPGSILNMSTLHFEQSKSGAEIAKSQLTTYLTAQRTEKTGALRSTTLDTERAKGKQQIAETQLTTMIDEFKAGKRAASDLNTGEAVLMNEMKQDTIRLAAEKQAGVSAQYEIQRNFADVMTGSGPLTDAMLDIAQGVGGETARVRAQAQAVKAARSLDSDALAANVELLKNEAQRAGTNIKRYSAGVVEAVENGLSMYEGQFITPERLKAALQAQAEEKNIPLFERIKGNRHFDQAMINEIVALNNTNFKIAGGFGMQDDPTLNIDNFATEEDYWHALRVQRISNLANTNASGLSNLKFGWVAGSLADVKELRLNIEAALLDVARGSEPGASEQDKRAAAAAKASLQGAYFTVRDALLNDDIRATMTDRESSIRIIEAELARIHGRDAVPSEPLELKVDATSYSTTDETDK